MRNALLCLLMLMWLGWTGHVVMAKESETKVTLDQVPSTIKDAIESAVGTGKLVDIGEIRSDGKTTYEIEMRLNGKEMDVLFDSNGVELDRHVENDNETDADDAEDDKESKHKNKKNKKNKNTVAKQKDRFQHAFDLEHRSLSTTGRNRFFVLEPGYQLVLEGRDANKDARLEVTVLDETKDVNGSLTRVVEERETVNGKLVEVSRNYFAICKNTGSVFYFGEDVDIYRDGKIVEHEGAWMHGDGDAHAGMMMPGECLMGAAYYQEYAPKKAMDRARIDSVTASIKTPAGEFTNCLKVWEENPLDGDSETKTFAPGIGLVQDEGLLLVKYGFIKQ